MRDLTGQVFGELTALRPTAARSGGSVVWECRCSCGKTCTVSSTNLVNGSTLSCGHLRQRMDFVGTRNGRLVAVKPQMQRVGGNVVWLCRCDCGNVALVIRGHLSKTKSCGCLSSRSGTSYARCPACGERFPVVLDGTPTPQFCPSCAPKYSGRSWRVCPICKALFAAPPSDKTVTCSKACSAEWRRLTHSGVSNKWGADARRRLAQAGQTENLKKGTAAAQQSPIAGRFETNQEAKIWHLITPEGEEIVVRNLLMWARDHTDLFDKPPGDESAIQIANGFKAIAQSIKGNRDPAMTYFGWTLNGLPEEP